LIVVVVAIEEGLGVGARRGGVELLLRRGSGGGQASEKKRSKRSEEKKRLRRFGVWQWSSAGAVMMLAVDPCKALRVAACCAFRPVGLRCVVW